MSAQLISLYGNDRRPRLLDGVVLPMTYRQIAIKRTAEKLGFIPIDAIITGATTLIGAGIGAVSNKMTQERQIASDTAMQKQLEIATVRNAAALQSASQGVTGVSASTAASIQKAVPYVLGIGGIVALTMFLKSRKKRR